MKVVHIVEDLKIGGIERVIAGIVRGIDKSRYEVCVWCLSRGGEIADELNQEGFIVEILGMKSHRDPFFYLKLAKKLRREKIDILHAHGYTATTVGRLAAILAGVPTIFSHIHSTYLDFSKKQVFIEKFLSRWSEKIICCSKAVSDFAAEFLGISPEKIKVIYNGVEPIGESSGKKAEFGISEDAPVVGCIASLFPHKGHKFLLEAVKEVLRWNPKVKFILVGDGPLKNELEEFAREKGIEKNVIFTGVRKDVSDILSAMDVVVLPSSGREGLGIALIEAMAMKKPVIGTVIGGIPEVIEHGKNGLLVPPANPAALAAAIVSVLADKAKAKKMGEDGFEIFSRKFTARKMVSEIEKLYSEAEKIRVAYISAFPEIVGGGQVGMLELLKRIDREKFLPFAVIPGEGGLKEEVEKIGIRAEVIHFPPFKFFRIIEVLKAVFNLEKFLKKHRIKIVHSDIPRNALYSFLSSFFGKTFVVFHARVLKSETFTNWLLERTCDRIICVSMAVSERFGKKKKTEVVYNGVDLLRFSPAAQMRKKTFSFPGEIVVGTLARLEQAKGVDVFLKAAEIVLRKNRKVRFVVVGGGDSGEIGNLSKSLGISENVVIAGRRDDIPEVLRSFDIFVSATFTEGFSRAVIEAMAVGLPVVATDVGGNREGVSNGETGFLVPSGNCEKLSEAILTLIEDDEKRAEFGRASRRRVEKFFSINNNVKKTEEIYEKLVAG